MRFVEIFTGKIISQSLHCYLVLIFALHKQVYILTVLQVRYVLKPFFFKKKTHNLSINFEKIDLFAGMYTNEFFSWSAIGKYSAGGCSACWIYFLR